MTPPYDEGPDPGEGAAPGAPGGPLTTTDAVRGAARRQGQRRHRRRRWLRLSVTLGSLAVLVVVALVAYYEVAANPTGPEGHDEVVKVTDGESFDQLLSVLSARGVVGDTFAFKLGDLVLGTPSAQPGYYLFHQHETFGAVRGRLSAGPDVNEVYVYPGYTQDEVAEQVAQLPGQTAAGFLGALHRGQVHSPFEPAGTTDLEGMLGTGAYLVLPGESDLALVRQMVGRFDATAAAAGLTPASAAALGYTPYQVLTAASIVQKEGYIVKNMGPVARVIYNRLAQGIPLQMNSTVLYSLGQDGGTVTSHDLSLPTPYNTYLHTGLTPTPICMPSEQALAAAVHPPPGAWLFFVVVAKDGTEAFADTYAEQEANEALAARRGVQ